MTARTGPTPGGRPKDPANRAKASAPEARGRANSLGLSPAELELVHAQLDGSAPPDANLRRQSARLSYRHDGVVLDIVQPGGGQTSISVACRNLSRTGMGFLHSSYLHVGTKVCATLIHQSGKPVRVHANVVRCRHLTRHVHEVGLVFDEAINVRDFMARDPLNQTFTCERVDPGHLTGTILIVAEYKIEQACVQSMLRGSALTCVPAHSIDEALAAAKKGVGIIICDDEFESGSGVDFVAKARAQGVRSPIILMSADVSEQGLARIRKAEADAFLAKPLKQDLLLRAIAEFLLVSGPGAEASGPMHTTLGPTSPMLELADDFVGDLHTVAEQVEALVATRDAKAIRKHCLRVGGPASSLGFEPIATLATRLAGALDASPSFDDAAVAANAFISGCRSAKRGLRPAAEAPAPAEGADHAAPPAAKAHAKAA